MPVPLIVGGAVAVGQGVAGGIAAGKKQSAAAAAYEEALRGGDAIRKAAAPRPEELAALEANVRQRDQVIARERALIEAVDPAIMEAGKQAYALLQGKEAQILGPIQRQRTRQREQLRESLRRTMGPGFESSSAGIEALTKFDAETSNVLDNAQQQSIAQLLQSSQYGAQLGRATEGAAISQGLNVAQAYGNIGVRQTNAESAAQTLAAGARQGKVDTAGGVAAAVGQGLGGFAPIAGAAFGPKMPSSNGGMNAAQVDFSSYFDSFKKKGQTPMAGEAWNQKDFTEIA